jgi:hypothetical protein
MPMAVALPPDWQKPSAAFLSQDKRSSLPWDGRASTSPGPNTPVYSTLDDGSRRAGRTPTFARSKRFSAPAQSPGPADYDATPRSRALGHSASAASIGRAKTVELPWEAEAKIFADVPGPGAYQGPVVQRRVHRASSGSMKSASPRFKPEKSRSPGAAAYDLHGHELSNSLSGEGLRLRAP